MVLHSLPPDQFDRGSNQTSPSNDPRRTSVRKLASRNQINRINPTTSGPGVSALEKKTWDVSLKSLVRY